MRDSVDTKSRILDAAEHLFAEQGYAATSMRNITAEAGVNLAAVNYHFGSKETLLFEVLGRRIHPLNGERLRRLDALEAEAGGSPLEAEEIVRAFVEPAFKAVHGSGQQGPQFMQLVGRTHMETNEEVRQRFHDLFRTVILRFTGTLRGAFPHLSDEEIRLRMFFMVGAMAHTMAWSRKVDWLPRGENADAMLCESLVQFVTAGMQAPVSALEKESA